VTNIQYNHRYLQSNCGNFRLLQEIVKERDGDVIYTGLGYGADSAERIASYGINNISTDELMPFCTTRSLFIYFIYLKLSVHVQNSRQQ